MPFAVAAGHRLEYELIGAERAFAHWIVFLHEGLGSAAMWRDFPQRVCDATGCRGLVYSRYGYGRSDALQSSRNANFMHDEAQHALPQLLAALQIDDPILFGHSDGGSIALLFAGTAARSLRLSPAALIVMAPHVRVEDVSISSIAAARRAWETTDLRQRLARYHDDPDSAFIGWNDIWLDSDFRAWNIEDCLPGIRCPVLAIQGVDDEYGTMEQIDRIARGAVNTEVELIKLAGCGHSPHRDQPVAVTDAVRRFIATRLNDDKLPPRTYP